MGGAPVEQPEDINLMEATEAIGLKTIVIDEDFDFATLEKLFQSLLPNAPSEPCSSCGWTEDDGVHRVDLEAIEWQSETYGDSIENLMMMNHKFTRR